MRSLVLFSLVLLSLSFSVQATLVPGSEKGVTAPVPDVAPFDQASGRIATDGDSFLAVWIEHSLNGTGDVHGARLTPEGKRVDDAVLHIATTNADENRVAIAFGGDRYFVVWSTPTALRARFVARDGAMSDVIEIAALTNFRQPQVAFNGSRFLVTWRTDAQFRGALVDINGAIVKTFDIATTQLTPYDPAVVAVSGTFRFATAIVDFNGVPNGNGYPADVGVTPIDADGVVGTRVVIAPATTPVFDLNAASSGSEFLVGWTTAIGIPGSTVRDVLVTNAGAGAIDVIPADGLYLHDLVADSSGFLIFYGADGTKYMRRPGAREPIGSVNTPATQTALLDSANNGDRTLVIVRGAARPGFEWGPAGGDLYVTRLDTMEIEPLVVAPRHQSSPDIAAAGDLRLAVWCEYIGSERRLAILGTRLSASRNAIDANAIDVHASVFHPAAPRVASNGTDWLVVWVDNNALYGARIAHDGTPLDGTPFVIATDIFVGSDLAVSWDGSRYNVVFFRGQFLRGLRTVVRVARIPAQDTRPEPELVLSEDTANEFPAIASGPDGSLVVWRDSFHLRAALLAPSGAVTPLGLLSTDAIAPRPAVGWNGNTFLVAAPFNERLQWFLVSATGVVRTPLSTFPHIDSTLGVGTGFPAIEVEAFGDSFLLFWNGRAETQPVRMANIYAARVNGEGILADGATFVGSAVIDYTPSIGAAGNLVVYSRKIAGELARVFAREVQYTPGKPRRRAVR
jgi:hypothetical protein